MAKAGPLAGTTRWLARDLPLAILNNCLPRWHQHTTNNLSYGPHPRMRLDVVAPKTPAEGQPVVVFYYGGRWQTGSRKAYAFVGHALASKGILCVLADYRLYPEAGFPHFLDDAGKALAWVGTHIHEHGGNPENLFLMGHSAGAHIAAMLALHDGFRPAFKETGARLRGLIGISGPYDFLPITDQDVIEVFGDKSESMESQPIHYVTEHAPPALLVTSSGDVVVRPRNAKALARRLDAVGVPSWAMKLSGLSHAETIAVLASPLRWRAPILNEISRFTAEFGAS